MHLAFAALYARVLLAFALVCPCPETDLACPGHHVRAAGAVASAALFDQDPEEAAARLVGAACRESEARTELQRGGPAVTYFQLEVRARERAALLADPAYAAFVALGRARACGGSMEAYAHGTCHGGTPIQRARAAAHRRSIARAREALACRGRFQGCRRREGPVAVVRRSRRRR